MRFPRPRITIRRLMIAVAVVAILMAGGEFRRIRRLGQFYQLMASEHRHERAFWKRSHDARSAALEREIEKRSVVVVDGHEVILGSTDGMLDLHRDAIDLDSRRVAYHWAMALKYDRAAQTPWQPVQPDPPEP